MRKVMMMMETGDRRKVMMETGDRELVFLYGTLKRGEANYETFVNARDGVAEFVCEATTVDMWPLVLEQTFNIPLVLYIPGCGHVSTLYFT